MVGARENLFENEGSQMAEKIFLRLIFENTVFHKRSILLIFEAEFTTSEV